MEHVFSPSQIASYLECPRKWGFRTIDKLPSEPNKSAALGTAIHSTLEHYLKWGELSNVGLIPSNLKYQTTRIAFAGINHLPAPKTKGMELERAFTYKSPEGFAYRGFIDVHILGSVYDHKSTGDFKYAKTPEDLAIDPQGLIYAAYDQSLGDHEETKLKWVYYRTKGTPAAKPIEKILSRYEVNSGMRGIDSVAREMLGLITLGKRARDLPRNDASCFKFGRCQFYEPCKGIGGQMTTVSIVEKVKAAEDLSLEDILGIESKPMVTNSEEFQQAANALVSDIIKKVTGENAKEFTLEGLEPAEGVLVGTADVVNDLVEQAQADKPKRGRGRPKKETTTEPETTAEPTTGELALYIDCLPLTKDVTHWETFLPEVKKRVRDGGFADYRLIEYGKGTAVLTQIALDLWNEGAITGNVCIDTRSAEGTIIATALSEKARLVVKGLR